jgi:hypothetical protein
VFPLKEGLTFDVRADFFNVFNRWVYPSLNGTGNALQPAQFGSNGSITNGYGLHRRQYKQCGEQLPSPQRTDRCPDPILM